jgi:hypothetical protein
MSQLSDLQQEFAHAAATLILKAGELGYGVTFGEAWRTQQQAQWDADHHTGVAHSLHTQRLAIDLNLMVNGVYQVDDSSGCYSALGAWWKTLQSPIPNATYAWGGDFKLVDLDHFSLSPDGVHE